MAAGFFSKTLSTLLSSASRWVEFPDGVTAPVHGAVALDPNTGLADPFTKSWPPRRYTAGYAGLTPAANPTDILAFLSANWGATLTLRRIVVTGIASTAAVVDVLVQRSPNGGGGTAVALNVNKMDRNDPTALGAPQVYTANRSSNGDGVSSTRPVIAQGKLTYATSTTAGVAAEFSWPAGKGPMLRDLTQEYFVVNMRGAAQPSGASLNIHLEWDEVPAPVVPFTGDSTTSNAITLFAALGASSELNALANIPNRGSNGFRLTDYLLNTNGITYPQSAVLGMSPAVLPICFGINDVRTGATTQAQLISMIDAAIYATLNGTTSGATYTSPLGAGTTFTWPSTIAANPDCKIILWGPNSFTSDDPGATGYVTNTGAIAGANLAAAAQNATDILYNAYQAFASDSRIFALVQKQDIFGRTCQTNAASGLMTDILHPNARGQTLSARQIVPTLRSALGSYQKLLF